MQLTILASLALALLACNVEALFWPIATTAGTGTLTVGGGSAVAFGAAAVAGVVVLKGLALAAILLANRNRSRGKRNAEEEDLTEAFSLIAATEPEACYRRLICDLATGSMEKSENDVILSLFNKPVKASQPIYEYQVAALVGKQMKNVQFCELRYSCRMTGNQIQKLFKH